MGCRSLSFAALAIWNSLPQHIRSSDSLSAFQYVYSRVKTYLCKTSHPSNFSLHNVASVFNLHTCNGLLPISSCIFHIASFLQNVFISKQTSIELIIIILLSDGVKLKTSRRGWVSTARAYDQNSVHCPQFLKPNTFQSVARLQGYTGMQVFI